MMDGLKDTHREAIVATIAANDRVERAVLFGSRATQTNTVSSDVDIALFGDRLTSTDQTRLAAALDEIRMAQSVDLLLYNSIDNRRLREHIRSHGVQWYARENPARQAPLRNLCEAIVDCPHSTPRWTPDGVVVLRSKNIRNGRLDLSQPSYTSETDCAQRTKRATPRAGDLVITREAPMGEVCMIPSGLHCCLGQRMVLLRPRLSVTDPRYLLYALQSKPVQQAIRLHDGTGSTVSNLRISLLENLQIPSHPLSEQRAIAHVLGTLDDKIKLDRRMSATLEAMARALFRSWFVDFDPVWAKMEGRDTGLPTDIADLFPDRLVASEIGWSPEGWSVTPMTNLMEVNPKRSLRRGEIAPYLDMANMPTQGHVPDSIVDRPFGSGMRFVNGDTLIARITPCLENGKTAYVDFLRDQEVGWGSTEYIVLKPQPPLPDQFAYCLARSTGFREFAVQNMSGTSGRQRVPASALSGFLMAAPPASLGAEFGNVAGFLFERASRAVRESRALSALRDALLPKLVSEELPMKGHETVRGRNDVRALVGAHEA